MNRPTILIVSDEGEFSSAITSCWLAASNVPAFVLARSGEDQRENFDLAIVGGVHEFPASLLSCLHATGKPVIYLLPNNNSAPPHAHVFPVPEIPGWPNLVIGIAARLLEAAHATEEAARLTEMNSQLEHQAVLGRYMLMVRHNLNNALTSILGNCDLILLDEDQLSQAAKGQVETIRNMSMRLNEIMARFTSLQKEMQLVEQQKKATARSAGQEFSQDWIHASKARPLST